MPWSFILDHDQLRIVPDESFARAPEGSPLWECWRAYERLAQLVYNQPQTHPSSVMERAQTFAYWAARAAKEEK